MMPSSGTLSVGLLLVPRSGMPTYGPGMSTMSLIGTAEFLPDDFDWKTPARDMVVRYIGVEGLSYAEATFDFPRAPLRIWPQRITTWDGGGFDRTFHRETVWHEVATPAENDR